MTITALNTVTGLLVDVDGTVRPHQLDRSSGDRTALQAAMGGEDVQSWALKDCPNQPTRTVEAWTQAGNTGPVNWVATALAALITSDHGRTLHGPVLLLTADKRTGRCHDLPAVLADGIGKAASYLGRASTIAPKVAQALRD